MWRPPPTIERFVMRQPGIGAGIVIAVGLLVCLIPYIGPLLGFIILGGGLGGGALLRHTVRRELETGQAPLALPAAPQQQQPFGYAPVQPYQPPPVQRSAPAQPIADVTRVAPQPEPRSEQRDVGALAAQLAIDPRDLPLDEQVEVAGETHYTRQIKAVFRACEKPITTKGATVQDLQCVLVPEPWNEYDQNAVAVVIGSQQVGHLPAELAADYSGPLRVIAQRGALIAGQARVWAKSDSGMVRARVTILVPAVDDL